MTKKQKSPAPGCAGQGEATHKKNHLTHCSKKLSPRQALCLKILLENQSGILSNQLREEIQTNNVHNYVKQLREMGLLISCRMVDFEGDFGPGKIGLFRLADESQEFAGKLLGVNR